MSTSKDSSSQPLPSTVFRYYKISYGGRAKSKSSRERVKRIFRQPVSDPVHLENLCAKDINIKVLEVHAMSSAQLSPFYQLFKVTSPKNRLSFYVEGTSDEVRAAYASIPLPDLDLNVELRDMFLCKIPDAILCRYAELNAVNKGALDELNLGLEKLKEEKRMLCLRISNLNDAIDEKSSEMENAYVKLVPDLLDALTFPPIYIEEEKKKKGLPSRKPVPRKLSKHLPSYDSDEVFEEED